MPEPRYGKWQLLKIPFLRFAGNPHQACGILERQSAQEQIVNQSEDGGVHPDRHRKSKDGKCGEPRRFAELSESKTNVVHKDKDCVLLKGSGGRSDGGEFFHAPCAQWLRLHAPCQQISELTIRYFAAI